MKNYYDDENDIQDGEFDRGMEGEVCDVCFEGEYEIVRGSDSVECNNCEHRVPRYG